MGKNRTINEIKGIFLVKWFFFVYRDPVSFSRTAEHLRCWRSIAICNQMQTTQVYQLNSAE